MMQLRRQNTISIYYQTFRKLIFLSKKKQNSKTIITKMLKINNKFKPNPYANVFIPNKLKENPIWTNPESGQTVMFLCTTKNLPKNL